MNFEKPTIDNDNKEWLKNMKEEHPDLQQGEVFLGNYEEVNENTGEFSMGQEEDDREKFEDLSQRYKSARRIRAFDAKGKQVLGLYGLAVKKVELEEN